MNSSFTQLTYTPFLIMQILLGLEFPQPVLPSSKFTTKKFSKSSSENPACFHLPPFMPLLTLPLCLRDVIHILSPLSILSNSICVHLTSTVSTGSLPVARETPFPSRNLSPPFYFTLPFSLRTLRGWHFPKKLRTFLPSAFLRALSRLDFDFVFLIWLQSLLIHAGSFFFSSPSPCLAVVG